MDCKNMSDFFKRQKLQPMGTRQLFDFITDVSLAEDDMETRLAEIQTELLERDRRLEADPEAAHAAHVDEQVFMQTFIPRTVAECGTEIDLQERLLKGEDDDEGVFAGALRRLGLVTDATDAGGATGSGTAAGCVEEEEVVVAGADADYGRRRGQRPAGTQTRAKELAAIGGEIASKEAGGTKFELRHASKEARKAHKALIKLQKAQKRKEKIKKKVKKRAKTVSNKKKHG